LASLKQDAQDMPRLKALHARLTQTEVRTLVDGFLKHGDHVALRDLVTAVVDHATLVERVPTTRSRWLRFEVCWTADVDKLLSAGLLWLADDVERPA
jgi:hypothetical protein